MSRRQHRRHRRTHYECGIANAAHGRFFDLAGARIGTGIGGGFRARAHRTHHRATGGTVQGDSARAGRGPADDHRSTLPARHRKSRSIELLIFYTIHDRRRSAVVCASTATAYNGRSCMSPSLRGGNGENRTACSKPNRLMAAFRLFA